jgi:hypothetical protein
MLSGYRFAQYSRVLTRCFQIATAMLFVLGYRAAITAKCGWIALLNPQHVMAASTAISPGCGTDQNGTPSDNHQCGVSGTNPYTGENASDLNSWCGGKIPGNCKPISSCNPRLSSGSFSSHKKYYLPADLNCGGDSLAILMTSYVDVNLNGHTIIGAVFWNGSLRGFHFFNGTLNCNIQAPTKLGPGLYTYACLANENNGGGYTPGGGDQVLIHHIRGQNTYGQSAFIRFTGHFAAPKGRWTDYPIRVYNNTFQSVAETLAARQHAGVYSENQPVEYFNNLGDCGSTGQANACQILEIYGAGSGSYVHNNELTCAVFNVRNGDTCRPILIDGARDARVAYNDIFPQNNRAIRLRDAFNAEVDHNFVHQLNSANGYAGSAIHAGDNDINSGRGQVVPIRIHNNTFELAANSRALHLNGQQGFTSESDTFACSSTGCTGAQLMFMATGPANFGYPVTVDAANKTITQASGNFKTGTSVKPGSVLMFVGFTKPGNNQVFTVTDVSAKALTVSDPSSLLVNETVATGASYTGITAAGLYDPLITGSLIPQITFAQALPAATLKYCGEVELTVKGTGSLVRLPSPCRPDASAP